jgi:hypothetical protein
MKKYSQHCLLFLLLSSYIIVGIIGHFEVRRFSDLHKTLQYVKKTNTNVPPAVKLSLTKNKLIHENIKIPALCPAILSSIETQNILSYWVITASRVFSLRTETARALHTPRAPPLA